MNAMVGHEDAATGCMQLARAYAPPGLDVELLR